MSQKHFIMALLLALAMPMQAQDACTQALLTSLEGMQQEALAATAKAVRVEMRITSVVAEDGREVKETVVYAVGKGRTVLSGEHFTILQDKNTKVAVLPTDSLIAIYQAPSKEAGPSYDLLNKRLTPALVPERLAGCRQRNKDGITVTTATWMTKGVEAMPGLDSITIQMDTKRHALMEVRMAYSKGQRYSSQQFRYTSYMPGELDERLKHEPVAYVLRYGQPYGPFKGFRVKDSRKTPRTNVLP